MIGANLTNCAVMYKKQIWENEWKVDIQARISNGRAQKWFLEKTPSVLKETRRYFESWGPFTFFL